VRVLLIHNYYQQPGGEDIVFANEKELLRRHGHEVVEFVEDNRRINAMNRLSLAVNTIWSERARRKLAQHLCTCLALGLLRLPKGWCAGSAEAAQLSFAVSGGGLFTRWASLREVLGQICTLARRGARLLSG
jgi:hypothetical protein